MALSEKSLSLRFIPAMNHNDAQAMLITEITENSRANCHIIAIINNCDWSIGFRIICDDLDSGEKVLARNQMCQFNFMTLIPNETLVFCQTWGAGRTLNFDAWGGTSPKGLNVWSLHSEVEEGLLLSGVLKKGWTVLEPVGFAEENYLSEDEYFHKSADNKEPQADYFFADSHHGVEFTGRQPYPNNGLREFAF